MSQTYRFTQEDSKSEGIAVGVVAAISVVGGIAVVVAAVLLVRCIRRRKFGQPEAMETAPPAPGAKPIEPDETETALIA